MYCIIMFCTTQMLPSKKEKVRESINETLSQFGSFYTPQEMPDIRILSVDKNLVVDIRKALVAIDGLYHFIITPCLNEKCDGLLYKNEWEQINKMITIIIKEDKV